MRFDVAGTQCAVINHYFVDQAAERVYDGIVRIDPTGADDVTRKVDQCGSAVGQRAVDVQVDARRGLDVHHMAQLSRRGSIQCHVDYAERRVAHLARLVPLLCLQRGNRRTHVSLGSGCTAG